MIWFLILLLLVVGFIWYQFEKDVKQHQELERAVDDLERKINELIRKREE